MTVTSSHSERRKPFSRSGSEIESSVGWAPPTISPQNRVRRSTPTPLTLVAPVFNRWNARVTNPCHTFCDRRFTHRPLSMMVLAISLAGCWSPFGGGARHAAPSVEQDAGNAARSKPKPSQVQARKASLKVGNERLEPADIWRHVREGVLARSGAWSHDELRSYVEREAAPWIMNKISEALLYQRASLRLGPGIESRLKEFVDVQIRKTVAADHDGIQHRYEKHLQSRGETLDDIRARFRRETVIAQYLQAEVRSKVAEPTRAELVALFESSKQAWRTPERRSMSLIDVRILDRLGEDIDEPTREQFAAARESARTKIEEAQQEIRSGADFADVAKRYSDGLHAAEGGRWGWIAPDSVRERFQPAVEALYNLRQAEISDILSTADGFFLVRCDVHEAASEPDFPAVQPKLKDRHFDVEYNRRVIALITELRRDARIAPGELKRLHEAVMELAIEDLTSNTR